MLNLDLLTGRCSMAPSARQHYRIDPCLCWSVVLIVVSCSSCSLVTGIAQDAVGLLNSLSSSLNCLAIPLAGRHGQSSSAGSPTGKGLKGKGKRLGRMQLL